MDARWGWPLAALAVLAGLWQYGWMGGLLGLSVVLFWLLLQFSRSLRVLRQAGQAPVGTVANAVMLQARLQAGMPLLKILPLTGSLGRKLSDTPEVFAWTDAAGDSVELEMAAGRLRAWRLRRRDDAAGSAVSADTPPLHS
jgi:hypothetical protein